MVGHLGPARVGSCVHPSPEGAEGGSGYQTSVRAAAIGEGRPMELGPQKREAATANHGSVGGVREQTPDLAPPAPGLLCCLQAQQECKCPVGAAPEGQCWAQSRGTMKGALEKHTEEGSTLYLPLTCGQGLLAPFTEDKSLTQGSGDHSGQWG